MVDPDEVRFRKKYPRFPGVAECVELLRSKNVHGAWVEAICGDLEERAPQLFDEIAGAFRAEPDARVRRILLSIILRSRLAQAIPLFAECLLSADEAVWAYAIEGLTALDTKEARLALRRHSITHH